MTPSPAETGAASGIPAPSGELASSSEAALRTQPQPIPQPTPSPDHPGSPEAPHNPDVAHAAEPPRPGDDRRNHAAAEASAAAQQDSGPASVAAPWSQAGASAKPEPPRRATAGSSPEHATGPEPQPATSTATPTATLLQRLKGWLDLALVADVFLVMAAALWFAVAVVLHSRGVEAPLRRFQALWEPLFTPAIGVLMAAALLSGALGWWQRRGQR